MVYAKNSNYNRNIVGSINGLLGLYDVYSLPVKDLSKTISPDLVYSNSQLTYYSDKAFVGESLIYDTTGKIIANLGSQSFIIGKNIIRINQSMPIGIYILTIKDGTNQISTKFIVEL